MSDMMYCVLFLILIRRIHSGWGSKSVGFRISISGLGLKGFKLAWEPTSEQIWGLFRAPLELGLLSP